MIGAFAPFRTSTAPPLPTLEETLGEHEYQRLELELEDYFEEDELEAMPLTHRAVMWRALVSWGGNAYIPGPTYATMHWDPQDEVWSLATRTMPKSSVEEVQMILSPLGAFASDGGSHGPSEVGSITDESGTRHLHPERRRGAIRVRLSTRADNSQLFGLADSARQTGYQLPRCTT